MASPADPPPSVRLLSAIRCKGQEGIETWRAPYAIEPCWQDLRRGRGRGTDRRGETQTAGRGPLRLPDMGVREKLPGQGEANVQKRKTKGLGPRATGST